MDGQLTLFVALTAIAVTLQAGVLVAIFLAISRVEKDTRQVRRKLDERIDPILDNVEHLTANARRQLEKVDRITDDMDDRLRVQISRLDALITEALDKVEEAGSSVRDSVAGPMREAAAVLQGVRAALASLSLRRSRRRAASDEEELFI